jgi:hypothetical protein
MGQPTVEIEASGALAAVRRVRELLIQNQDSHFMMQARFADFEP